MHSFLQFHLDKNGSSSGTLQFIFFPGMQWKWKSWTKCKKELCQLWVECLSSVPVKGTKLDLSSFFLQDTNSSWELLCWCPITRSRWKHWALPAYTKNILALPEKRQEICCWNLEVRAAEVLCAEMLDFEKRSSSSGFALFAIVKWALTAGLLFPARGMTASTKNVFPVHLLSSTDSLEVLIMDIL